jgi:hypothetical protein
MTFAKLKIVNAVSLSKIIIVNLRVALQLTQSLT